MEPTTPVKVRDPRFVALLDAVRDNEDALAALDLLEAGVAKLTAEWADLLVALEALVAAVDETDAATLGVFVLALVHGQAYDGPTHHIEMGVARAAIAKARAPLTDGRHEAVTLDEEFAVTLYESGAPIEVASGGCEDIVALAMRLAISQMIAEKAGHPLSLLILDEPFGSLDETRRANVLALIRRLRSTFRQVIVISHVDETKHAVDHVVQIEFDEAAGMTRVLQPAGVA